MNPSCRLERRHVAGRSRAAGAACMGLLLTLGWHQQANAGSLVNVAASLGFFMALAALLMSQALPAQMSAEALPMLGVALLLSAGAVLLWRVRRMPFAAGLLSFAPRAVRVPTERGASSTQLALPEGFDRETLLADLRRQFVKLQAAWDAREIEVLRALTTPDMLVELCTELPDCLSAPNRTDVMTLHAKLLSFDELGSAYLASVEFSGMICECAEVGAVPFRELWMLVRRKHDGAVWRLARQLDLP